MSLIEKVWSEIRPAPKTVKEFGFILSGFFLAVPLSAAVLKAVFWKAPFHYWFGWPALAFASLILNVYWLRGMGFIYRAAMVIGRGISWVVMRFVLGVAFYILMAPASLVMKLLGRDLLDERADKSAATYWCPHPPRRLKADYERLF